MSSVIGRVAVALAASAFAMPAAAVVTVSVEAVGVQSTTLANKVVYTFDGATPAEFSYSAVDGGITAASQYGGAGGTGFYGYNTNFATVTLNFVSAATYFGLWASAIDPGNRVEFFNGNTSVGFFRLTDILPAGYGGNPNANFRGQNSGQGYAFFNFTSDTPFTTVSLQGGQGGTFEYDNLTASRVGGVPEPSTWAMMIGGFGLIGGAMRARRRRGIATTVRFA